LLIHEVGTIATVIDHRERRAGTIMQAQLEVEMGWETVAAVELSLRPRPDPGECLAHVAGPCSAHLTSPRAQCRLHYISHTPSQSRYASSASADLTACRLACAPSPPLHFDFVHSVSSAKPLTTAPYSAG
jgi:hypothetical protein